MQTEIDALREALKSSQAERDDARQTSCAVFDLIDMMYVGAASESEQKKLTDHVTMLRSKVDGWRK